MSLNESTVEDAALGWLAELGYTTMRGPELAPSEPGAERESFSDILLVGRLHDAIVRPNLGILAEAYPPDLQDEATKTVLAQAELLCADFVGGKFATTGSKLEGGQRLQLANYRIITPVSGT